MLLARGISARKHSYNAFHGHRTHRIQATIFHTDFICEGRVDPVLAQRLPSVLCPGASMRVAFARLACPVTRSEIAHGAQKLHRTIVDASMLSATPSRNGHLGRIVFNAVHVVARRCKHVLAGALCLSTHGWVCLLGACRVHGHVGTIDIVDVGFDGHWRVAVGGNVLFALVRARLALEWFGAVGHGYVCCTWEKKCIAQFLRVRFDLRAKRALFTSLTNSSPLALDPMLRSCCANSLRLGRPRLT